jgi:hypothetical protein
MKRSVLFIGLFLIVAANVLMMYYAPYGLVRSMEGYQNVADNTAVAANNTAVVNNSAVANNAAVVNNAAVNNAVANNAVANNAVANNAAVNNAVANNAVANNSAVANNAALANNAAVNRNAMVNTPAEGFASYNVDNAGGAKDVYQPIGQYDGVKLSTGNSVSSWRYTAPNEPLTGAEFVPGDNELFMFKNNQCKPECCGASFSCGGGCVCTTPQQRQYIAGRGGNRTSPEDSA